MTASLTTSEPSIGRDRVLGILFRVLAMLFVHGTLWPARARVAIWSALARALRSLAALARFAPDARDYPAQLEHAVRYRSSVYQELGATLRISCEAAASRPPKSRWRSARTRGASPGMPRWSTSPSSP